MSDNQEPSSEQQTLTVQHVIDFAAQHHTAGDLSQAEDIYQQILRVHPYQTQALHLLGVIAHQRGENGRAVTLIEKCGRRVVQKLEIIDDGIYKRDLDDTRESNA